MLLAFVKRHFSILKNVSRLRYMLLLSNAELLTQALMTSRLDYCNALSGGCSEQLINKLQSVQNAAAGVLTKTRKYENIRLVLSAFDWLLIKHSIHF